MKDIFIKDLNNDQIGYHFNRLCILSDIESPTTPKEIAEFFKNKYWKYDAEIIPKAIDSWMGNPTKKPVKLNLPFLTQLFNDYIQNNFHTIKRFQPVMIEAPKRSDEDNEKTFLKSLEICYYTWNEVYRDGLRKNLFLKVMSVNWKSCLRRGIVKDKYSIAEINEMCNWISEYEDSYLQLISLKSTKNAFNTIIKVNRDIEILREASKLALYFNEKYERKN